MIRSLLAQTNADAGVDTSQLVTARLELPPIRYSTVDERREFYRSLEEHLTSMPGMQTSFASAIPLGGAPDRQLVTDLHPDTPPERQPEVGQLIVSANYFDTLGAGAVRGRSFQPGERERVTVINERLAAMYFGGIDPVGRRIRLARSRAPGSPAEEWLTIVGVAPDVRQESTEGGDFDPIVYLPYAANPASGMFVITRSAAGTGVVAEAIRTRVRALDPNLPVFDVRTADDRLAADRWAQRFATTMFATFAAIALILAVIGLYAVTAYAAAERTREIGVRIALGARHAHVAWLVVRRAALQLAIGLVIGLAGGVSIAIVLPSQLTGVSGVGPGTFLAVATLLVTVGVIASLVPARRATRMDPVAALRLE
jgi:predicted permease